MGSTSALPVEIVNIGDDDDPMKDDDVSVLYATPPVSRKMGTCVDNAISVEEYTEDRELRLAIMASLLPKSFSSVREGCTTTKTVMIDLSKDRTFYGYHNFGDDNDDVQFLNSTKVFSKRRKLFAGESSATRERGESSNAYPIGIDDGSDDVILSFVCEICVEQKPTTESFCIKGCTHSYCSECMVRYVASKLQDNVTQIQCPFFGCQGLLEPEHCHAILPQEVFDRWVNALCEAAILADEKFYCPFKDCSALLIDDRTVGEVDITLSECPYCRRLFCASCKVPWHSDISCSEFQKLSKDEREREDIMLMKLAKDKNWKRCPQCKFYVEKSDGCLFMKCRCGYTFCYNCRAPLVAHYCPKCKH